MELSLSKILVVDDESHNLTLLSKLLLRHGYTQVQTCDQPATVTNLVRQSNFDLVLLDLTMPRVSGLEILEQLKPELQSPLPLLVLVLSGDNRSHSRRAALALGAKDFVCKPFDPPEVLSRIENLLEIRSLHRRIRQQQGLSINEEPWLNVLASSLDESLGVPAQVTPRRREIVSRLSKHLHLSQAQSRELDWGAKFYSLRLLDKTQRQRILAETAVPPGSLLDALLSESPAPPLLLEILLWGQAIAEQFDEPPTAASAFLSPELKMAAGKVLEELRSGFFQFC